MTRESPQASIGVESTARAANERGYELTIVTNAVTDPDEGAHRNSGLACCLLSVVSSM